MTKKQKQLWEKIIKQLRARDACEEGMKMVLALRRQGKTPGQAYRFMCQIVDAWVKVGSPWGALGEDLNGFLAWFHGQVSIHNGNCMLTRRGCCLCGTTVSCYETYSWDHIRKVMKKNWGF